MPFTPFHFGPGLLLKSIGPRACSLTAFVLTQVLIDLESLHNLVYRRWPVHRFLHSLPGALLAGGVAAAAVWLVGSRLPRHGRTPLLDAELRPLALIVGGVLGGLTHSLLDAMFHDDVRLFYPAAIGPSPYGVLGRDAIHWGCAICAVVGAVVLLGGFRGARR